MLISICEKCGRRVERCNGIDGCTAYHHLAFGPTSGFRCVNEYIDNMKLVPTPDRDIVEIEFIPTTMTDLITAMMMTDNNRQERLNPLDLIRNLRDAL